MLELRKRSGIAQIEVLDVPTCTFWDIGNHDGCAIWFHQMMNQQDRFIDYEEDHFQDLRHYVKLIKDKPLMTISNMLVSQEEIDFISAYDAKEALYKAQSYLMGYKLGYTDVTLTYPELKDLELLLSLYENDDLFDLIEKYSDI